VPVQPNPHESAEADRLTRQNAVRINFQDVQATSARVCRRNDHEGEPNLARRWFMTVLPAWLDFDARGHWPRARLRANWVFLY
jgi:hypothetical protein